MPIHDWTRVPAGLYHHFHQSWTIRIADALNADLLPPGLSALVEQRSGPREGDVLTIEGLSRSDQPAAAAVKQQPSARFVRRTETSHFADRANRIVVKHHLGRIVAVIEVVSPGNKESRRELRKFVDKSVDFLTAGVHLLIVDPFPPTSRDPHGIHKAIWDEFVEEEFAFPEGKDRIIASYEAGLEKMALIEPIAVGDALPSIALFLGRDFHVETPLETTYMAAWEVSPRELRRAVETGVLPE